MSGFHHGDGDLLVNFTGHAGRSYFILNEKGSDGLVVKSRSEEIRKSPVTAILPPSFNCWDTRSLTPLVLKMVYSCSDKSV